jgi:hypothetical protein
LHVIIDKRTHEIMTPPAVDPYHIPPLRRHSVPPRFQAPATFPLTLGSFSIDPLAQQSNEEKEPRRIVPTIPAAHRDPTGLGAPAELIATVPEVFFRLGAGNPLAGHSCREGRRSGQFKSAKSA